VKPVTLRVICEGPTERNFVTRVLGPHLRQFAVFTKPEVLGGIRAYDTLRKAIQSDLGRSRAHEYVTTMFDLYALPRYPGDLKDRGITGAPRADRIEAAMAEGLNHPRFLPYIQVHEFEALVFVDLDQLLPAFPDGEADGAPERLRRSIGDLAPEDMDPQARGARRLTLTPRSR
jgi:hypothetical protein